MSTLAAGSMGKHFAELIFAASSSHKCKAIGVQKTGPTNCFKLYK